MNTITEFVYVTVHQTIHHEQQYCDQLELLLRILRGVIKVDTVLGSSSELNKAMNSLEDVLDIHEAFVLSLRRCLRSIERARKAGLSRSIFILATAFVHYESYLDQVNTCTTLVKRIKKLYSVEELPHLDIVKLFLTPARHVAVMYTTIRTLSTLRYEPTNEVLLDAKTYEDAMYDLAILQKQVQEVFRVNVEQERAKVIRASLINSPVEVGTAGAEIQRAASIHATLPDGKKLPFFVIAVPSAVLLTSPDESKQHLLVQETVWLNDAKRAMKPDELTIEFSLNDSSVALHMSDENQFNSWVAVLNEPIAV